MGLYYKMVNAFLKSFDNVHILLYDDFAKNTASELRSIFKFLNLNENIEINYKTKHNVGGVHWNNSYIKEMLLNDSVLKTIINKYISKSNIKSIWSVLSNIFKSKVVKMNAPTKDHLIKFYKEDIIKLSKLINRDLNLWLR